MITVPTVSISVLLSLMVIFSYLQRRKRMQTKRKQILMWHLLKKKKTFFPILFFIPNLLILLVCMHGEGIIYSVHFVLSNKRTLLMTTIEDYKGQDIFGYGPF